jgi:hypothetical protein
MARTNKTEDEILNPGIQEEGPQETIAERLQALSLDDGADLHARIYRVQKAANGKGRVFVGALDDYVDEEYIAEEYGGGTYLILYTWKENGRTMRTSSQMSIAEDYGQRAAPIQENKSILSRIFGSGFSKDDMTSLCGILKEARELFAPPPPQQIDIPALINALNANKGPSVSDSVMIAAMDSLKAQNTKNSISQQIQDLKALKELTGDSSGVLGGDEEEEEGADHNMDIIIKTGMSLLQGLLQKNNDNYQAAGEEARKNATVNALLLENNDLAQKFFDAAAAKYGDAAAKQLAEGFGFNITRQQPAQIPVQENGVNNG